MDKLRAAAIAGQPTFGSWVTIGDTLAAEAMARAGFDWLILDAQHGGVHEGNMLALLQATELGGTPALVRVAWNDPARIMRALDQGAAGVVVPMVSNAEEARGAAEAVRYPPAGARSYGKVRNYQVPDGQNEPEPLCLVMIETREALDQLDAIAGTAGVDGLFVGPLDLSLALGFGASFELPAAVLDAIAHVASACERHRLICGAASLGTRNAEALLERGVRFITLGSDMGFLKKGARGERAQFEAWRS